MKIKLSEVEKFRKAAKFLSDSKEAVMDTFDDYTFIREYRNAVGAVFALAQALGETELSIRG